MLNYKRITINGMRFVIRRINPLLDFPIEKIPQLFTEVQSARKLDATRPPTAEQIHALREQMLAYIEAGVVEPRLVPVGIGEKKGKEDGLTAEDLCRDPDMGMRLYWEILTHSLNTFKGIKGLFFSIRQKFLLSMLLRLGTAWSRWTSSPPIENPPPMSANSSISSSSASPSMKNGGNWNIPNAKPVAGGVNG